LETSWVQVLGFFPYALAAVCANDDDDEAAMAAQEQEQLLHSDKLVSGTAA
jgi:hypothetical protein